GSPHALQVDGLGGGHPNTSKVAIVDTASRPDADVDYLFAQISVDRALVDTNPPCGNILAGVGPFAIEAGLMPAHAGETCVRIFNRNTGMLVRAFVQTPGGEVEYDGDTSIDGVAGTAAPVKLEFMDTTGAKTGGLLPTRSLREIIDGLPVTLIDYAQTMMLTPASALGIVGDESPEALDAMVPLKARLEAARREAGRRMGLGDVANKLIPKISILSRARQGSIRSRVFTPELCHRSHPVTGGLCVATAT